ncbi:MAG: hypothetical protein F6K41_24905 [Symploca sp. SIO3E6]|nr:hypothetical protein [Caldora sp. SIO3E6]
MQLTFTDLLEKLPPDSVEFVGDNQFKLNLTQITGEELGFDSSVVEPITKLLDALVKLTQSINDEKLMNDEDSIKFASKDIVGTPEKPMYEYIVRVDVNPNSFLENLVDPTAT